MSTRKAQREKDIQNIRALLRKLERHGDNIQTLLWQLMDEFDNDYEEKNESKNNNDAISLLMDNTAVEMCNKGHTLYSTSKHLRNEPCIVCGRTNPPNKSKHKPPTNKQIQSFLNSYDTSAIPFSSTEYQKNSYETWISNGHVQQWPLHFAAITGNLKQVQHICKLGNIDVEQKMTPWDDGTPLQCASYYGQLSVLIELMKYGAKAISTPYKTGGTPYADAVLIEHKAIVVFYEKYVNFMYNITIDDEMNRQCNTCYLYDSHFNRNNVNDKMSRYVYCVQCSRKNIETLNMKKENNEVISKRIIKTLQKFPEISVDTLCQMKDVKAMDGILKEIIVSGNAQSYTLWLLDIDNFKSINSALTHSIADTKIQALGSILKGFEAKTQEYWAQKGLREIYKIWCFRQGGDEFALVVWGNNWKPEQQQQIYNMLRSEVHQIRVENMKNMKHLTVSIGACIGVGMTDYSVWIKTADEMAEMVKNEGKDGIKIYWRQKKPFIFKSFDNIKH